MRTSCALLIPRVALSESTGGGCECTIVQCVKSVGARLLVWRIGGQRSYMFDETLQRTMTVGLFGTKLQPHALSHSLTPDAQAVQAPSFTTFALAACVCVHYVSLSYASGSHK
jgi:hypothetical protein